MSHALIDLLFWTVLFIVFFFGFKWLQNRRKARTEADAQTRDESDTQP